jgi:DNA-binding transcriptional LysR family regulator
MQIEDLHVIMKVAEFKSITAAATSLNMQTATASAAVKRVEKALGIEIFVRTTRHLRLSSAGEKYIPQCQHALELLDIARQNVREDLTTLEGELRVAVSSDLGRNMIVPWLDEFMDAHPLIRVKVHVSDSNIDFYRDSVDIALRYGSPKEANIYGFKICDVPRVLCASTDYIEHYGAPVTPGDLATHNGLFYQLHNITHDTWEFVKEGKSFDVKMRGNRASNDSDLVRRWCVSGKGIAAKSLLDMSADIAAKRVLVVMPDYTPKPSEFWLICPSRQSITPAVRKLRDMLQEKCEHVFKGLPQH